MSSPYVHESAIVDANVKLGEGARIWHFVHVCEGASIGAGASLGQNVFVAKGVRVGARVKVQNNVSLYEGVDIADDVFLGPSCVFTNVFNPRAFVERKHEYRPTPVGRGASIGANATIICGNSIGEYAFVAANATVTKPVPAYALVVGTPARQTGWMCQCGEKLPEGAAPVCKACGSRYRVSEGRCEPMTEKPVSEGPVPLLDLEAQNLPLLSKYQAAFERVMRTGQFILGPEVDRFEKELCQTFGYKHAIGVSSGTDALLLAFMALGIGPGDEVITTAFSFFATGGCVSRVGARPVFVDIDPVSFNIDPARIERAITPRTKAILPVHLFGQAAELETICALGKAHGIPVIEDAAQALSTTYRGKQVGTFGAFGCFSFFPSKNLGAFGDAGLLTSEDDELAERARMLRAHGSKPKYFHKYVGGNFRLDALQAALLSVKLPYLAGYTAARRENAAYYDREFQARGLSEGLLKTPTRVDAGHVYNQYVIRSSKRDALKAGLTEAGIGNEIYYPLGLHLQECFASLGYKKGDLPETERACAEVLAIPVHGDLSAAQRARVVSTVESLLRA